MPASKRTHGSRSRPYDRRSPTTQSPPHQSPPPTENPGSPPDHPGLPAYAEYKRIEAGYLHSLSPRKRDKALITQTMFDKIWDVLHQPDACTIETPQFRFWVRKMFVLSRPGSASDVGVNDSDEQWGNAPTHVRDADVHAEKRGEQEDGDGDEDEDEDEAADLELERTMGIVRGPDANTALLASAVVLHEHRPVAIMEQLYELFCYCHVRAGHGGRDKTCAVIRQHYSWVPKELTAQFVKACPTCTSKRSGCADPGVSVRRRAGAGRGREKRPKRKTTVVRSTSNEEVYATSSLAWPTTGGPLDPANPQPCGIRKQLRVDENAEPTGPSSFLSPVYQPKQVPLENHGWNNITPSSFHLCDPIHALGTTSFPPVVETVTSVGTTGSPRTGRLPSLASVLSNGSLDDDVNLTGLGGPNDDAYLPPVLRPLRLTGPVPVPEETNGPDLFQIDPVLLSLSYPELEHAHANVNGTSSSSPFLASAGTDGPGTLMHMFGPVDEAQLVYPDCDPCPDSTLNVHPRSQTILSMGTFNKPSSTRRSKYQCHGYGYDDGSGPLAAMLLPNCSTDDSEVGRELDGTLSRFSITTDA